MLSKNYFSAVLSCCLVFGSSAYALQTVEAQGNSVSIYDSSGKVVAVIDAAGNKTRPDGSPLSIPASAAPVESTQIIQFAPVTIHVPADQPTIQAAINAASPGDTVLVSDGIYKESINFQGKAITVSSVNGAAVTTINGGNLSTVVFFVTGETSASVLNGFTITNGNSGFQAPNFGEGGGIVITNASPTITNNVIFGNTSCVGAGIGIAFSGPLIQGNTISNNVQSGCTGGIGGGGISVRGSSSGTQIIGNTIANNSIQAGGGGISLFGASAPLVQNNTFTGNDGGVQGGGIDLANDASAKIVDNAFIHNTASQGGGIYWLVPVSSPGLLLLNNTFAGNTASQGSAIYDGGFDDNMTIQNNILAGVNAVNAISCLRGTAPAVFSNNDAFTTNAAAIDATCAYSTGSNGNISLDPLLTDVANGNLFLQPTSPAIDAGNNTVASFTLPPTDLGGHPRIHNAIVDMGALEFQDLTTTTFSTTSLVFSQQLAGTTSLAQTVTITNTGAVALQITPFVLTGDFAATDNCHTSSGIAPGASCTINVTFTPTGRFTRTGQLNVFSNDSVSPTTIHLSGTGIAPVITLSVSALNFNTQLTNTPSTVQPIQINNVGDAPLTVTSIVATGDFSQTNNCGTSVAANAGCTINVTFTPTLRGFRSGSVTITDNAAGNPHVIPVQGAGIGAAATLGSANLSFPFGQLIGTISLPQQVTLTSTGETTLHIASITASGDFAQTNNCGASLPSAQSCIIQVTFSPAATGQRSGSISIADDAAPSPQTISLTGLGADFSVGSQPNSSSTATVNAGGTATYNLSMVGTLGAFGTINFACSGAPAASTCTVTPTSAPLNGTTPVDFNVAVTTTARASAVPTLKMRPWMPGIYPSLLAWAVLMLLLVVRFSTGKPRPRVALASSALMLVMLIASCGGGSSPAPPPPQIGTPAGTSVMTVTATSGNASKTFNLTLIVK